MALRQAFGIEASRPPEKKSLLDSLHQKSGFIYGIGEKLVSKNQFRKADQIFAKAQHLKETGAIEEQRGIIFGRHSVQITTWLPETRDEVSSGVTPQCEVIITRDPIRDTISNVYGTLYYHDDTAYPWAQTFSLLDNHPNYSLISRALSGAKDSVETLL